MTFKSNTLIFASISVVTAHYREGTTDLSKTNSHSLLAGMIDQQSNDSWMNNLRLHEFCIASKINQAFAFLLHIKSSGGKMLEL